MALLSYRATPLQWCNLSPAELLQGRTIRTNLPQSKSSLIPQGTHTQHLKELHGKYKANQSKYYDNRHRVRSLPPLPNDTPGQRIHRNQELSFTKQPVHNRT